MKKIFNIGSALIILAVLGWLAYFLGSSFLNAFAGASDTVKAASIAAFVSVVTVLLGRYFEQARELKSKTNAEKIKLYERFFTFYFSAMGNDVVSDKPSDPDWMAREIFEFQRELIMWAPDKVLKSWVEFREALVTFSAEEREGQLAERLAPVIRAAASLLKCMRQDLGYNFTTFSARDLAIFQLKADDPHFGRLMEILASE